MSKSAVGVASKGLSFSTVLKQSVGIDVSKDKFDVCYSERQLGKDRIIATSGFKSTAKGFEDFWTWIKKHGKGSESALHFTMEATGVYYEDLAYFLHSKSCNLSVILPTKFRQFAKSSDYKSKTDKIDAILLAQMSLEKTLELWSPPSASLHSLKRLDRERNAYIDKKTAAMNQLHAMNHSHAPDKQSIKRSEEHITFLKKVIANIEREIKKKVEQDAELKERIDKICTIKGVGIITAVSVVAETNGFILFKNKAQLVSYAGYDVVEYESGSSVKKPGHISKRGNSHIRRALFCPAMGACKKNGLFEDLNRRICERTGIKMKGNVAAQRKLLVLIYTLYKKNEAFDSNCGKDKK